MVVKIFKENPLSYGLYKTLPEELNNVPGITYSPTQIEIDLLKSNQCKKYENGRIVLDFIKEQKRQEKILKNKKEQYINSQEYKENRYCDLVDDKIRQRYSLSQELAILRQKNTKNQEYIEYNNYCEQCKLEAKIELGMI